MTLKSTLTIIAAVCVLFTASCITQAALADPAEQYIKTRVEKHEPGEKSSIRIFPMGFLNASNCSTEIQFTAYKYKSEKKLVLCIRAFQSSGSGRTYDSTEFVELTPSEAQAIITNYQVLEDKVLAEQPVAGEWVYHDYTVNDEVFISYRATLNPVLKKTIQQLTIDLWVNSVKYTLMGSDLKGKMQSFLLY